jgi:hypothetical protein
MSAKDNFENNLLAHIFQNATIPNIGDATGLRGSSAAGSLYVALYTGTPSDSASGTECDYAGYARVALERSVSGFSLSGNAISNASALSFPQCVSGVSDTAVAFAVCTASSVNVDDQIQWGPLLSSLEISAGITPEFNAGDLVINVD